MLKYKYRDGLIPNTLAFTYCTTAFVLAIVSLSTAWWPVAILLLAHSLVIAAYLLHECAHNTLFANQRDNQRVGALLSWWLGSAYTPYRQLRDKHMRHHVQREDVLAFNAHAFMERHAFLRSSLRVLSYFHVPAFEVYTHVLTVVAPFIVDGMQSQKKRVLIVLASRLAFFTVLFFIEPWAPLMYLTAWLLFLSVLNLMDSMQHSYEIRYDLMQPQQSPRFDAAYEEANTYSNLLSDKHRWLNLLVLNFCYHNAHHHKATEPWYALPTLHDTLYPAGCAQQISLADQLRRFHQYRLRRLRSTAVIDDAGVDGVSFLVGI